ncbi:hypothetical protein ACFXDE_29355 [Kitasatospora sp. NPDC059408]|uniref:hypothetical protein n=1 Tax=Kitasatospora sp. NPDC059408 TaxID=3346823 RepID=UPI00367DAA5E
MTTATATVLHPVPVEATHAWVITLQRPAAGGLATVTVDGVYAAQPGTTRQDAYQEIRAWVAEQHPHMAGANVLFFSLEPNRL